MFPSRRIATMGGDKFRDEHSLIFDGTDERVATSFIPNYIHTNASMAYWVKMYDFTSSQVIGHHGDLRWYMGFNTAGGFLGVANANNSSSPITITPTPVVGKWIHFAVTAIDATATLYINGVAQGTMSYTQNISHNPDEGLWVGAANNNGSPYGAMNCAISEVAQYNVGLTAVQIKTLYNGREPYNHKEGALSKNLTQWLRMGDGAHDRDFGGSFLITDETNISVGDNEVVNGNFTNWTGGNPDNFSVTNENFANYFNLDPGGGAALVVSDNSTDVYISQASVFTVGKVYRVRMQVKSHTSGQVGIWHNSATVASRSSVGWIDHVMIAKQTGLTINQSGADVNLVIDNCIIQELGGSPGVMENMETTDITGDTP